MEAANFVIDHIRESELINEVITVQEFDLIILSHNLSSPSAMEILTDYIANGGVKPVIFILPREEYQLGIEAMELGASDFVLKPLIIRELIARARANIRTFRRYQNRMITFGPLTFDTISKNVWLENQTLALTKREKGVLEVLLRYPNQFSSKEKIISNLFSMNEDVTLSAIQTYVHRIRHKINHPSLSIITSWGAGYKIELQDADHNTSDIHKQNN